MMGTVSLPLQPDRSPTAKANPREESVHDVFMGLFSFVVNDGRWIAFSNQHLTVCSPLRGVFEFGFLCAEGQLVGYFSRCYS
jgi:hypothetical protein